MSVSQQKYRANRDDLLDSITGTLSNDERFVAAWLTGSLGRGDADSFSDLDLTLVVSDAYSQSLCRRAEQVSPQTTDERLALFSQFGQPAVIHENNHNAPAGGTFTFILYAHTALMVDWILVPFASASRPAGARMLFAKTEIPLRPPVESESLEQRVVKAAEIVAFFWMMMAVTVKYIHRRDGVFVTRWTEELHGMLREVERLLAGAAWQYQRGSLGDLEPDSTGQARALLRLGERMQQLLPQLTAMGGQVLPSPLPEIRILLDLGQEE
jgi:hypothetical protein